MNRLTTILFRGLPLFALSCGCAAPAWNSTAARRGESASVNTSAQVAAMGGKGAIKPAQANGLKAFALANRPADAGSSRRGQHPADQPMSESQVDLARQHAVSAAATRLADGTAKPRGSSPSDLERMRRQLVHDAVNEKGDGDAVRAEARYQAALACWQQGDAGATRVHLDQALAGDPGHREANLLWAEWCLLQELPDHAIENITHLCRANPEDARACHTLGMLLAATGRVEEAVAMYQQAAQLQPDDALYQFTLDASMDGEAYVSNERYVSDDAVSLNRTTVTGAGNRESDDAPANTDSPETPGRLAQPYFGQDLESVSMPLAAQKAAEASVVQTSANMAMEVAQGSGEGRLDSSSVDEPRRFEPAANSNSGLHDELQLFQEIASGRSPTIHGATAAAKRSATERHCSVCTAPRSTSAEAVASKTGAGRSVVIEIPPPAPQAKPDAPHQAGSPEVLPEVDVPRHNQRLRLQLGASEASQPKQASEHPSVERNFSAELAVVARHDEQARPAYEDFLSQAVAAFDQGLASPGAELLRKAAAATANAEQRELAEIEVAVEALNRGQSALAIDLLEPATRRTTVTARVFRTLGTAYYRMGDYAAAQETLEQAVSLDSTSALSYFLLGSTLNKLGKQREAATHLQRAAQLDPRFAERR